MIETVNLKIITRRWLTFLGSNRFFYAVIALFLAGSIWLVFTSRYPMAFDENYHYGIIQQYAGKWSPFINNPAPGTDSLGDIARYPSYLGHYLLSFPYRVVSYFSDSDVVRILALRIFNVGLFTGALVIFKKMFEKTNLSPLLANISLYVFTMIPTVPFLAAHVSYDNLSILLTALTLLLAVEILQTLKKRSLATNHILLLGGVGCLNSLVKYTYLPIFVAVCVYIFVASLYTAKKYHLKPFASLENNFAALTRFKQMALILLVILGGLLCIERYGINMVRFGQPVPDCAQVRSEASCMQYGPWGRDYELKQRFEPGERPPHGPVGYSNLWVSRTMREFFFTIRHDYDNVPPLRPISTFAWLMLAIGAAAAVLRLTAVLKNPYTRFFFVVCLAYTVAVWLDNFGKYNSVHFPVAVHARYLFPLYPIMFAVFAFAFARLLEKAPRVSQHLKVTAVASTLLFMLYGGGASSYIVNSDASWYWQNRVVVRVNDAARSILSRVIRPAGVKPAIF